MFFKKKQDISNSSLSKLAWQRFLKNKLALVATSYIIFITLAAILGYLITPDFTPFANNQILEIATHKPGSKVQFLLVKKNENFRDENIFSKMIWGKKSHFKKIPFSSCSFKDDQIIIKDYSNGDNLNELREFKYSLADVCYSVKIESIKHLSSNKKIKFQDLNGNFFNEKIEYLQKLIRKNHIIEQRFMLGTDRYGRDYLSQLIIGARVSLSVGFIAVLISLLVGILLGSLAGFFRSWVDQFIIWVINIVWSIPTLLLVIAITFALGKGFWQVFIAVGLTMWVEVARIVRGQIFSIREKEFIEAGKALAFSNFRIIFYHILPNIMGPVIVISAANFASAILIEAGLSFLGIGVQPPTPSWGGMIKENYAYIILDSAYLAILPGIAIMLVVLSFMIIGNALRDAMDVKTITIKE
jgi:peptide/nickel transport system permease protein